MVPDGVEGKVGDAKKKLSLQAQESLLVTQLLLILCFIILYTYV